VKLLSSCLLGLFIVTTAGANPVGEFAKGIDPHKFPQCYAKKRMVPQGEIPTLEEIARDRFCTEVLKHEFAPQGFVAIYGSAQPKLAREVLDDVFQFARLWTLRHGNRYPIATAAGPGVMELANLGAKAAEKDEVGAPAQSLGFSLEFGFPNEPLFNSGVNRGYTFSGFEERESAMINGAKAAVFARGGVGTWWEIFQTLAKIQTRKNFRVPIILLGREPEWAKLLGALREMLERNAISIADYELVTLALTPESAVEKLDSALFPKK
jgi:predicted Rossmann-fold nucleotide-binding protein